MKEEFHEDFMADSCDPLYAGNPDFDWETLYARLGEDVREGDVDKRLEETVIRLLQLLVPESRLRLQPSSVGLRLIALAWVLSPGYFEGTPSLRVLAGRCGVSAVTLAHHTGRYSRLIRWRNRGQGHAWNWRKAVHEKEARLVRPQQGAAVALSRKQRRTDSTAKVEG